MKRNITILSLAILICSFSFSQKISKSEHITIIDSTYKASPENLINPKSECDPTSCSELRNVELELDVEFCQTDCNIGGDPGIFSNNSLDGCSDFSESVWYDISIPAGVALLKIDIESESLNNPILQVFQNDDCYEYTLLQDGCGEGENGTLSFVMNVNPSETLYTVIVSDANNEVGDFDICFTILPDNTKCNVEDEIYVTNTSMGSSFSGPYLPGEIVSFCYDIPNYVQKHCLWFHGLVPSFGECWSDSSFNSEGLPLNITTPLESQGSFSEGIWEWYPDGEVLYLAEGGSLSVGTPVGAGWFYTTDEEITTWGDGNIGCGISGDGGCCESDTSGLSWSICFDLIVDDNCQSETNCDISFKTFSDSETGNFFHLGCTADEPTTMQITSESEINTDVSLSVNEDNNVILSAEQANSDYQWLDCNNDFAEIIGANNQTYLVLDKGSYAVKISIDGCSDTSDCIIVDEVSLKDNKEQQIKLYPNPSSGLFTLESKLIGKTYTIHDAQGRLIQSGIIKNEVTSIHLKDEVIGVYYLKADEVVLKIVKE